MQEIQDTLQEVRAVKTRRRTAGPWTKMLSGRRVSFVAIRTVASGSWEPSRSRLTPGAVRGSLAGSGGAAGLANMERDEPTLVAQMIRVAVRLAWGGPLTWKPGRPRAGASRKSSACRRPGAGGPSGRGRTRVEADAGRRLRAVSDDPTVRWPASGPLSQRGDERGLLDPPAQADGCAHGLTSTFRSTNSRALTTTNYSTCVTCRRGSRACDCSGDRSWAEARPRLNQITMNVAAIARSPQRVRNY